MATTKQREAVDRIVENRGMSLSKAMREVGYDETTARNPKNLTDSKGYKEICEEYGLTPGLIARALVEDIEDKVNDRVDELKLGADILGMVNKENKQTRDVNILVVTPETLNRYVPSQSPSTSSNR